MKQMKTIKEKPYQYTVLFERNENDGYTVTVPALPGLVTEGKDLIEARVMAEDAIRCYLEGLTKSHSQIPEELEIAQMRLSVKL